MIVACKQNSCALIGGEMAEMPDLYKDREFDLAGTIVGIVEQEQILPRSEIKPGDQLISLPSSGLHTNGYSLARKIIFTQQKLSLESYLTECQATIGELLLSIHRSYFPLLESYLTCPDLKGLAHITGGGIAGNLKRILPENIGARITLKKEDIPTFFHWLQHIGKLSDTTMRETFNLGTGMLCVVENSSIDKYLTIEGARWVGEIVARNQLIDKVEFI